MLITYSITFLSHNLSYCTCWTFWVTRSYELNRREKIMLQGNVKSNINKFLLIALPTSWGIQDMKPVVFKLLNHEMGTNSCIATTPTFFCWPADSFVSLWVDCQRKLNYRCGKGKKPAGKCVINKWWCWLNRKYRKQEDSACQQEIPKWS